MLHDRHRKSLRVLTFKQWCLMASRAGDRIWLVCCGNSIVITAPSLIALLALSARQAWRAMIIETLSKSKGQTKNAIS